MSSGQKLLRHLAALAHRYGLIVWQWKGHGPVGQHAADSYHERTFANGEGQAFDAFGATWRMRAYAWHLRVFYKRQLSEGIFSDAAVGRNLSVKHGQNVDAGYWGSEVWNEHRNHVHVARGEAV
jgi:hypothetical protein